MDPTILGIRESIWSSIVGWLLVLDAIFVLLWFLGNIVLGPPEKPKPDRKDGPPVSD